MYSILIPTYKNLPYLESCIESIMQNSHYKTHEICIHINGHDKDIIDYLSDYLHNPVYHNDAIPTIKCSISEKNLGVSEGFNRCTELATQPYILLGSDDYFFSKDWDYKLHEWQIELDKKFPDYQKFICFRFCEPGTTSFPPMCSAGKAIEEFDESKLNDYIKTYSCHKLRGCQDKWLWNAIYPRDTFNKVRWSSEFFPIDCADIDFGMQLYTHLKDNNIKFLMLSVQDGCVYHFQKVTSNRVEKETNATSNSGLFEKKWNKTVKQAYELIYNEVDRSESLIRNHENISMVTLVNKPDIYKDNVLKSTEKDKDVIEYIPIYNAETAAKGLNEGISKATNDLVICIHQDMTFEQGWYEQFVRCLNLMDQYKKNWGVVGFAGTTDEGQQIGPCSRIGEDCDVVECQTLDCSILIIRKSNGLKFDENLKYFHAYGEEISLQAHYKGLNVCCIAVPSIHNTKWTAGRGFSESFNYVVRKWKKVFPKIYTTVGEHY